MIKRLLVLAVVLATLGCTLLTRVTPTPPPVTDTPTAVPPATGTRPPRIPVTVTPRPATATPARDVTPAPEMVDEWLSVFQALWEDVRDYYVYPDYHGVDWDAVYDEYRPKVEAAQSAAEFYDLMHAMVALLNDDHSRFLSPDEARADDEAAAGQVQYGGVGILTDLLTEKRLAVILMTFPGSPAEQAGLKSHDSVLAINGVPAIDAQGKVHIHDARGEPGTAVTLTVRSPGGEPRDVVLIRARIRAQAPIVTRRLDGDIGYLMIPAFDDDTIGDRTEQALEELVADGPPLRGLVLDLRINGGGSLFVAQQVLSLFTQGTVGYFVSASERWPLSIDANDIGGSQDVPLVMLVSHGTASFGEVFTGVLQDSGRARVVGTITDGNVEILLPHEYADGSRAWIAEQSFELPGGKTDWEEAGIIPDVLVDASWDEFTEENDPQLAAALDLLR